MAEYRYKTSYETYDDDFDKAVNHFPKELFEKYTNNLKINVGKNVTANQSAQIAVFIIRSIEFGDEHEVEFEICEDTNLGDDEIEIILWV